MPNENAPVCACGVVVDLPKSRNISIVSQKLTILVPKSKGSKADGKGSRKQQDDGRAPKNRTLSETCSSSSEIEPGRPTIKNSKHENRRLVQSRRTRSVDRAESHYTYIDSGSSILGDGIRENAITEALYATIPDVPSINESGATGQLNSQSRSQVLYALPSMTSPPPTYDVAISRTRQTGLPPTYEEYLRHRSRSHTPPPPWSDSITTSSLASSSSSASNSASRMQVRRELLASQPELREYFAQLTLAQSGDRGSHYQHQQQQQSREISTCSSNQQALREQQVRVQQRARAMPPRSQSASRAQQQRIAKMYEDAAFCMETTVLQSAFDQGFGLCNLM